MQKGRKVCRILALLLHDCEYGKRIRGDERRILEVAKQFKKLGAEVYVIEWSPSLQKSFYNGKSMNP